MFVATRLLRCRQVDAIMKSAWKCGAGEKAGALGHLKCRSEYHSKLHKNLIITMCLVIVTMHAQYCEESCGVVELVQAMLLLTPMHKLILCMVRYVRTIGT